MNIPALLLEHWPLLLGLVAAGIVGGLIAGLLGVGGGIVIVPALYVTLGAVGVAPDLAMKVAVASSLATIVGTSLSSARAHHKRGAVDGTLLRTWSLPIIIGVVLGALAGGLVNGTVLTAIFAVVALLVAANLVFRGNKPPLHQSFPNGIVKQLSGFVVGLFSVLMGIGGGTLSVPILTAFGYDIRKAVGTASAIGFLIAIPGMLIYIATGWNKPSLPLGSLGYVNWIAVLFFVPLTMALAPLGAKLAHSIPREWLRWGFAVFLTITSARMAWDLLT